MSPWLHERTSPDIAAWLRDGGDTALLPCGATEQHGPHLPLGTDTIEAIAVVLAAAEHCGVPVLPPVWVGWSPHHMAFAGTLTLRPETLQAIVVDLGTALYRHGFRNLVIVNGHRGANLPPLEIAATHLVQEVGLTTAVFDIAISARAGIAGAVSGVAGSVGHACEDETSQMLAVAPDLVRVDRIPLAPPEAPPTTPTGLDLTGFAAIDPWSSAVDRARLPVTAEAFRERTHGAGFTGSPWLASREKGARIHAAAVDSLCRLIDRTRSRPATPPLSIGAIPRGQ